MPALSAEQLKRLPANPYKAVISICEYFEEYESHLEEDDPIEPRHFLEYFLLLKIYTKKAGIQFPSLNREIIPNENAYKLVRSALATIKIEASLTLQKDELASLEDFYSAHLNVTTAFEISEGDVEAINRKLLELRNLIGESVVIEPSHKERILNRLEALQGEIHQKNSNFDKLTGSLLEVIMLAQRAGEAAQTWVNIAKDIFAIIWVSQGHVYQLATDVSAKLLR